jgi:hypothetical protein
MQWTYHVAAMLLTVARVSGATRLGTAPSETKLTRNLRKKQKAQSDSRGRRDRWR